MSSSERIDTMDSAQRTRLRQSLGQFATGVTVVTAATKDGTRAGLTVNSFCSVSLDPPLILWCLARYAGSVEVFAQVTHYAIHVLGKDQENLSRRFSEPRADRFKDLALDEGRFGVPLLRGCLARFVCEKEQTLICGDHFVHVGRILDSETVPGSPLIFHNGRYGAGGGVSSAQKMTLLS